MLKKTASKEWLQILKSELIAKKQMVGCRIKSAVSEDEAWISTTKLNGTMAEVLGKKGEFFVSYNSDGELKAEMVFAYSEGDAEYDILCEFFEDLDDESESYDDVTLANYTESHTTGLVVEAHGVSPAGLANKVNRIFYAIFDWLDIIYENILDECGE